MYINYLTQAFRKLRKYRDYTLLNVFGLGLSIGCATLIFILLHHHYSTDQHHKNLDRLVRVVMDVKTERPFPFSGAPNPMGKTLREECPLLETVAMSSGSGPVLVSIQRNNGQTDKFKEDDKFAWAEPEYLDILGLPMLHGELSALNEPNTLILTPKMAAKYFGDSDPLGKTIRIDNKTDLRVAGIMEDIPSNTDYKFEMLGSWATLKTMPGGAKDLDSWGGARGQTYCFGRLQQGQQLAQLQTFLAEMDKRHPNPGNKDLFHYKAMPLADLHFAQGYGAGADRKFLWALGLIGIFLLITACVNFINMATAQSLSRAREVGVRKSLGSTRGQLFWQFMSETGVIVMLSIVAGLVIARLVLPYMNAWMKESLAFDQSQWAGLVIFLAGLGMALTFLAGFYPGWIQSRFQPSVTLKGNGLAPVRGSVNLRKVLVTTQFAISQMLIIGAAVVTAQMQFAREADWGFRPGVVVTVPLPEHNKIDQLKTEIGQISGVKSVSLCSQPPASTDNNFTGVQFDNRSEMEPWVALNKPADENYLETFGLTLVAGRNLMHADTVREFLVNESFVKKLNLASPEEILNRQVKVGDVQAPVVGVVRDYHDLSLSQQIDPLAIGIFRPDYSICAIQLAPGDPGPVLSQVKKVWENTFPDQYYEQKFMDEQVGEFFETETMTLRLVRVFAGIAIFIGCLGLYGLSAFMVAKKRKEVGVRKTLGAGVFGLVWLFWKEYFRMIAVAFVLAAPIAWWAMDHWLQDYAYRITLGAGVFLISLCTTVIVAALTVGGQSLRAALANPVKALRSE